MSKLYKLCFFCEESINMKNDDYSFCQHCGELLCEDCTDKMIKKYKQPSDDPYCPVYECDNCPQFNEEAKNS